MKIIVLDENYDENINTLVRENECLLCDGAVIDDEVNDLDPRSPILSM